MALTRLWASFLGLAKTQRGDPRQFMPNAEEEEIRERTARTKAE
jgi:hypothetical protein